MFNNLFKKISSVSTIGFTVIVLSLVASYLSEIYLLSKIDQGQKNKETISSTYEDIFTFKYNTELLLTSYNFKNRSDEWINSSQNYLKSFTLFEKKFTPNSSIVQYHNMISKEIDSIKLMLQNGIIGEKNNMEKPLLVRLGELSRSDDKSEYYIAIRDFTNKIEHIKQYQTFLIEELYEFKKDLIIKADKDIHYFKQISTSLPIFIIIFAIFFAIFISKKIDRKERELNNTKNLLENIMNSIPIRIFWKDIDGIYGGANQVFLNDCSFDSIEQLVGKNDFELPWKDSEAKDYVDDDKEVIKTKKPKINIEERQKRADGKIAYLNTSKVPFFDHENNLLGIIGLYEDITGKKESQEIIKQQEMQLVQQSRLAQMGEMISMIAHQWRQPLTVISTTSGGLQLKIKLDKYEPKYFIDKLEKINQQTVYLSDTIDDFRNFFRPDKLKTKIYAKDLILDTIKIIDSTLESQNIKIELNFCCSHEVDTYTNELKQVLLNIIKNAQDAFEDNNIIENRVIRIKASCSINSRCQIVIEDNAGGIPQDIIEKIFDPYFSTKDEKNGTGLGLYMSKMIVEKHCGGKLYVKSKGDKTEFFIEV